MYLAVALYVAALAAPLGIALLILFAAGLALMLPAIWLLLGYASRRVRWQVWAAAGATIVLIRTR